MKSLIVFICVLISINTTAAAQNMRMSNPDRGWENTGVILTENIYSITDKGAYSIVNSYLSFRANDPSEFSEGAQVELHAWFQLPESYEVTDLWLWVGDDIMQARMYDRWTAERIYEGIVNRRRDPAIIYKNGNGWYELRIYPFKPDQTRKIKITYLVPNNLNASGKSIVLPDQLQELAYNSAEPGFLIFTDLDESEVSISGVTDPNFESGFLNNERFLKTTVPSSDQPQSFTLTKNMEIDSVVVRTYQEGEEHYFDISVLPFDLIETNFENKILVLVDHEAQNTGMELTGLFETIKQELKGKLSEEDSFNVLFSGLSTVYISDEWIPATAQKIDSVFTAFDQFDEIGFSNLDNLFTDAFDFSEDHLDQVSIVLIASTQNLSNINTANTLLDALDNYSGGNFPKTIISDIQTSNFNYEWVNGRYYRGNEYLYLNLSRDTEGEFFNYDVSRDEHFLITSGFEVAKGRITDLEVYPLINDGFSYSRFSSSDENSTLRSSSFYQIGKYTGTAPFSLQISGFFQNEVFNKQITVNEEDLVTSDSTLAKIWVGQKIKQLEQSFPSNEQIQDIIDLSLEHRVLSKYTSFLALEPSDTVFACATCIDESALVPIEEEEVPSSFEVDSLSAYPNPFNPSVNINIQLSEVWDASNSSIEIYSIIGQKVASLSTQNFNGLKNFQVIWNVGSSSGLATGVYLVVLRTPYTIKTLKITYLK